MSMRPIPQICDLAAALKRMGNNVELLKKVVEFFREDSGGIFQSLQQAVALRDFKAVQHAAHSLRGLIGNFSAEAATLATLRLEEMGKSGDLAEAPVRLLELGQELTRLDANLTTEMAKLEIAGKDPGSIHE